MEGPGRALIAGLGAWKLGGGCFSSLLLFGLFFWLLGFVNC